MRVVVVEPGKPAYEKEIENELSVLQEIVGGYIQVVYPFKDNAVLVCNEDGKLNGLPINRSLKDKEGRIYDFLSGTFFICGDGGDDFVSLTDEQVKKYLTKYKHVEIFSERLKNIFYGG